MKPYRNSLTSNRAEFKLHAMYGHEQDAILTSHTSSQNSQELRIISDHCLIWNLPKGLNVTGLANQGGQAGTSNEPMLLSHKQYFLKKTQKKYLVYAYFLSPVLVCATSLFGRQSKEENGDFVKTGIYQYLGSFNSFSMFSFFSGKKNAKSAPSLPLFF